MQFVHKKNLPVLSRTLTGCQVEAFEFDGFDVVDESRHLLCGVHLNARCTLQVVDTTDPSICSSVKDSFFPVPDGSYLISV